MLGYINVACFLWCVLLNNEVSGVTVPFTPCPKLFNYFESETHEVFGAMTFKNDLSGQYDIEVNMSIATVTDKNIRCTIKTPEYRIQNGEGIEYYVLFPFNHTFPKLTSVTFNGVLHCVGPPEEANKDHGVTPLSVKRSLTTKIVDALLTTAAPAAPSRFVQIVINKEVKNDPACGMNVDSKPLVFSGLATRSGEYPWLVAIFVSQGTGGYSFLCGGSLISTKHIVTAAHCMRNLLGSNLIKEDLVIILGKHNIKNWARGSTIRGVKEYYIHPEFKQPADADIALLLLDEPVTYDTTLKPICLWDESDHLENVINLNGTVAGWGKDESGKDYVDKPTQIQLPIISQEICLRSDPRYLKLTSSRSFCAGNVNENRGPCSGDSGSGFVMSRNGIWKLRGIVSIALLDSATRICDVNNYIVFTDASKFVYWIQNLMETS